MSQNAHYISTPTGLQEIADQISSTATGKKCAEWIIEIRPVLYVVLDAKPPYKNPLIFERDGRPCIAVDVERQTVIQ